MRYSGLRRWGWQRIVCAIRSCRYEYEPGFTSGFYILRCRMCRRNAGRAKIVLSEFYSSREP